MALQLVDYSDTVEVNLHEEWKNVLKLQWCRAQAWLSFHLDILNFRLNVCNAIGMDTTRFLKALQSRVYTKDASINSPFECLG